MWMWALSGRTGESGSRLMGRGTGDRGHPLLEVDCFGPDPIMPLPMWCLPTQSHRLWTFSHAHMPVQEARLFPRQAHLWSILSPPALRLEPKICEKVFTAGHNCLCCPPSLPAWVRQTCVQAAEGVAFFFLGWSHHVNSELLSLSHEMACFHSSLSNLTAPCLGHTQKCLGQIWAFILPMPPHSPFSSQSWDRAAWNGRAG